MRESDPMTDTGRASEARDGAATALPWFLLGLGLGAGLALLFAPERGEDARAAVKKRVRALRDVAGEQFEEAREAVADGLDRAVEAVTGDDDQEEAGRSKATAREALQRRLRAARARRRPAASGGGAEGEGSPS